MSVSIARRSLLGLTLGAACAAAGAQSGASLADCTLEQLSNIVVGPAARQQAGLSGMPVPIHRSAFGARDFGAAVWDKMPGMIAGRLLSSPLYSGVPWDAWEVLPVGGGCIEVSSVPRSTIRDASAAGPVPAARACTNPANLSGQAR